MAGLNFDAKTGVYWSDCEECLVDPKEKGAERACRHCRKMVKGGTYAQAVSTFNLPTPPVLEEKGGRRRRRVSELNLSFRSTHWLEEAGIKEMDDLLTKSEEELLSIKHLGRKSLEEIKRVLRER